MSVPRFLGFVFEGYKVLDVKEFLKEGYIEVYLDEKPERKRLCHRCGFELSASRGKYRVRLEGMPIMGFKSFIHLWRYKGNCLKCRKARSEKIDFISTETPHLTADFAWWIGRLCEIAPVSRVAELNEHNGYTTWRLDYARMRKMLTFYKIPKVKRISVDEVYARRKPRDSKESWNRRFFTVITDLDTRRVIWVSEGRDKESLDEFFKIIGKEACEKIKVIAMDQHDAYKASAQEYCQRASIVWDQFHIMKNFEEAVNEQRRELHSQIPHPEIKRLTRGKYRFVFLKRASQRTATERRHINDVLKENESFAKLEIIKERMLTFFHQDSLKEAKRVFEDVGDWAAKEQFWHIVEWHNRLEKGWNTLKNYYKHKVTTAVSEGFNNVIKVLKRKAYGYRNMAYFKLKIMQVCGYLNSKYISPKCFLENQAHALI